MLKSMTGFGKAEKRIANKLLTVELRTLNSKGADINIRVPSSVRSYEAEIRNLLIDQLERGKIDFSVSEDTAIEKPNHKINIPLAKSYYKELKQLAAAVGSKEQISLSDVLKMPEVISRVNAEKQLNWKEILPIVKKAIADTDSFRKKEGAQLEKYLNNCIKNILSELEKIIKIEPKRKELVGKKLQNNLSALTEKANYDKNRFEQELIYYIEKLDISEEIVRLKTHCKHFSDTIRNKESQIGRKLGFISQEIGREINTIGSKANDAEIQQIVVQMKDELEKVKEQVLNVL